MPTGSQSPSTPDNRLRAGLHLLSQRVSTPGELADHPNTVTKCGYQVGRSPGFHHEGIGSIGVGTFGACDMSRKPVTGTGATHRTALVITRCTSG